MFVVIVYWPLGLIHLISVIISVQTLLKLSSDVVNIISGGLLQHADASEVDSNTRIFIPLASCF